MNRLRSRGGRRNSDAAQDVNPMDSVSNLADAMLVLAVGIMLALIINWNVDITPTDSSDQTEESEKTQLGQDDMTETDDQTLTQENMSKIGDIYYDEATGTYYAVTDEE